MKTISVNTEIATAEIQAQNNDNVHIYEQLPVTKISFSPLNYRRWYDEQALQEFAESIALHGVLAPVLVRPAKKGYELVVGERRLRGAQIAGIKSIPASVREMTDEEVKELQLVENLQREDPHPLHESEAVYNLQQSGLTIDQIATRLGKSKAFVYNRLKLGSVEEPFKELCFAGKLTLNDVLLVASLSQASQQELYQSHFEGWKKKENFQINNIRYYVRQYKYDLTDAPFNTKDKKLLPDVGACNNCLFNSATLKTLFPEMAKEAVCGNKDCFKSKCIAGAEANMKLLINEHQPNSILLSSNISEESQVLIDSLPELVDLPRYYYSDVLIFKQPEAPEKSEYTDWDFEKQKEVPDRNAYQFAMQEYKNDLQEYNQAVAAEETKRALYFVRGQIYSVYCDPARKPKSETKGNVTAKVVQEAIKNGTVTTELLEGEISRIEDKEKRSKELDREKVQAQLHESFADALKDDSRPIAQTDADTAAMRMIIYNSLSYSYKKIVEQVIFPKGYKNYDDLYALLAAITPEQIAFMVRLSLHGAGDSKLPNSANAYLLYKAVEAAGFDVAAIEQAQETKANERNGKVKERVKELKARLKRLQPKKAA